MDKFDERAREMFSCVCDICKEHRYIAAQALRDVDRQARAEDIRLIREVCSKYADAKERGAVADAPDPESYSAGVLMHEIIEKIRTTRRCL